MMLWLALTLMTSAAAVLIAAPFLRRFDGARAETGAELAVYKDQIAEVAREAAQGAIEPESVGAAETEIKRRLLTADRTPATPPRPLSPFERNVAAIAVTGIVVLGSVTLYALIGRPELPAGYRTAGRAANADPVAALVAATRLETDARESGPSLPAASGAAGAGDSPSLPGVEVMIERLAERLRRQPGDAGGWRMLGWSYFSTERYQEAADAYAKAAALQPDIGALKTAQGEALVRAAGGEVKGEALALFEAALKQDAREPRARFFKGLAKEQAGQKRDALADFIAALKDAGPDDTWAPELRQRVAGLARELGTDVSGLATTAAPAAGGGILPLLKRPAGAAPAAPATASVDKGPSAADVKAAAAMPPEARNAMIRGMVDGLASRLKAEPRDTDGWIKLMRSRQVLGEADAARQALATALEVFADAPAEQSRLRSAATELGVGR